MKFRVFGVEWAMAASQEFDIMICARGFLAFDGKGRMFRQR